MTSSTPIAPGYRLERRTIDPVSAVVAADDAHAAALGRRGHRDLSRDVVMLGAPRLSRSSISA